jgi:hypothetical protein
MVILCTYRCVHTHRLMLGDPRHISLKELEMLYKVLIEFNHMNFKLFGASKEMIFYRNDIFPDLQIVLKRTRVKDS